MVAQIGAYRGSDRRRATRSAHPGRLFGAVAPLVVLAAAVAAVLLDLRNTSLSASTSDVFVSMGCAATAALAVVVTAMLLVRWRVAGEIRSAAVGLAVFLLLGLHPAFQGLAAALHRPIPNLDYVDLGLMVSGVGLLLVEQGRPEVNTRRRAIAILALGLLIWAVATGAPIVASLHPHPGTSLGLWSSLFGSGQWPRLVFAAILVGLAGPMCFRSVRRSLGVEYWVGLSLVAWTAGIAVAALLPSRPLTPAILTGMRGLGVLVLLVALLAESASDSLLQRSDLFASRVQTLAIQAEQRAYQEDQRSRAHQARNVVMAVQTAGLALQKSMGALSDRDRTTLTGILKDGLAEIDQYVAGGGPPEASFYAGSLLGPLRSSARLLGRELVGSISSELAIQGSRAAVLEALRSVITAVAESTDAPVLKLRASATPAGVLLSVGALDDGVLSGDGKPSGAAAPLSLELVAAEELLRRHGGRLEGRLTRSGRRYVVSLMLAVDSSSA